MDKSGIVNEVRERLAKIGPSYRFDVLEEGVRQEQGWWYFPTGAIQARTGVFLPREFVITTFANLEGEIHDATGENVLFIPFTPKVTEAEPQAVTS